MMEQEHYIIYIIILIHLPFSLEKGNKSKFRVVHLISEAKKKKTISCNNWIIWREQHSKKKKTEFSLQNLPNEKPKKTNHPIPFSLFTLRKSRLPP